jgi:hypothetical protein
MEKPSMGKNNGQTLYSGMPAHGPGDVPCLVGTSKNFVGREFFSLTSLGRYNLIIAQDALFAQLA